MGHEVADETRRKIAEKLIGSTRPYKPRKPLSTEHRQLLSKRMQALWAENPARFHTRGRDVGHEVSDKTRKRISETHKRFWNSLTPEEQQTRISYALSRCRAGRTFPEELLDNLLQHHYPNEWTFVGDGSFILNNRNPDFLNIQRRGVIEVFGEFWHDPDIFPHRPTADNLVNHYKQLNYTCLILWDYEIYSNEALNRIQEAFYAANTEKSP
jgi:hypothetical protein